MEEAESVAVAAAAVVVVGGDDVVGDIAPTAAGDEDFGAGKFSAVQQKDPGRSSLNGGAWLGGGGSGEDRGDETRGTAADDGDVAGCGSWGRSRHGKECIAGLR